jgi:hypothetical protein
MPYPIHLTVAPPVGRRLDNFRRGSRRHLLRTPSPPSTPTPIAGPSNEGYLQRLGGPPEAPERRDYLVSFANTQQPPQTETFQQWLDRDGDRTGGSVEFPIELLEDEEEIWLPDLRGGREQGRLLIYDERVAIRVLYSTHNYTEDFLADIFGRAPSTIS